jgi:ATP-dependent helicase Lhr and Lhr-like helicase
MTDFPFIESFFASRQMTPFAFQRRAWDVTRQGVSQLIQCPTGSGKTLAACGAVLDALIGNPKRTGLTLLYITPLRAMTRDLELACTVPLEGTPHRVMCRNGDSTAAERSQIFRKPPQVLLTTPESLSVLLSSPKAIDLFRTLELVVVDEWHDLWSSKRGIQTLLCLARLRQFNPQLVTTGLSATLANPLAALQALIPVGHEGTLTTSELVRPLLITVTAFDHASRLPWAGYLGLTLLEPVAKSLQSGQTTLLFTNTRNQAEHWFQALSIVRSDLQIALHHGSLAREAREAVETALKYGTVDLVVATSALDLGVDFQAVDRVIQVGSPRSVSRLLQRAGRGRHRPGETVEIELVPTHRLHLHEYAALAQALDRQHIEPVRPPAVGLDVLLQHLVTLAMQQPWHADAMLAEIRTIQAYASLDSTQFESLLAILSRGSDSLDQYDEFKRLVQRHDGTWSVATRQIARRHRMSIGTIVANSQVRVKMRRGKAFGEVEETFAARLKSGDVFRFAGKRLKVLMLRDGELIVAPAGSGQASEVPRWTGGRLPLSDTLADCVFAQLCDTEPLSERITNAAWLLAELQQTEALQRQISRLPQRAQVLVERLTSRDGHHAWIYPFAGWLVHQALAPLIAHRIAQMTPSTITWTVNDYGIEWLCAEQAPLDLMLSHWKTLLTTDQLLEDLQQALQLSELARRQFRATARIAGWVFQGYPGRMKSSRALQTSAGLLFDVLSQYDPEHLLLYQAKQDVLREVCDIDRLVHTCNRLRDLKPDPVTLERPSPLGLPLLIERLSARVSSETLQSRLAKLTAGFDD